MKTRLRLLIVLLCAASFLSGCALHTVDEMYRLPKRSKSDSYLQSVIDQSMAELDYSAPIAGENQQTVQTVDLNGDGLVEFVVFARDSSAKNLRILIFFAQENSFTLGASIETSGYAFEQVEYVDIDDQPGLEMVVGRQVSDQILRSMSVYSFASGEPEQLITANYQKFLTCDLDQNGKKEVMLIQSGQTEADRGIAVLYSYDQGHMVRSREAEMSTPSDCVKRIMTSRLSSGEPAVYVASSVDENAIITDVFSLRRGSFANISFSNDSGTSVQTLRNYYVYADDIDGDGVLELPDLITMQPIKNSTSAEQQYLIRWYAMDIKGKEVTKLHTFHNYVGGWYLELDEDWAERISVIQTETTFWFYVWDPQFTSAELLLSLHVFTGSDREEQAVAENRFVLYRAEGAVYSAKLEGGAIAHQITQDELIPCFRLIHQAWKTGET